MTEPPIVPIARRLIIIVAVLLASLQAAPLASADAGAIRVFYYGDAGSFYLGKRHAASWHQETPDGWPEVVDLARYGIATSDHSIPFGTELCLEVISFPAWGEGMYDNLVGNVACGVVIDRMPLWVERRYGPSVDIWSALARELFGEDYKRVGTIMARVDRERSKHGHESEERFPHVREGDVRVKKEDRPSIDRAPR